MTTEIKQTEENYLYYYIGNGKKYWTSNPDFARLRSIYYKTFDVYVEKF